MNKGYDTVIVGGGVVGCAIAYNLARLAPRSSPFRILLLERNSGLARDGAGHFLHNFENCFRGFTGARIASHWAGRYDVSPDSNPIIGSFPGKDGLIAVCGLSGGGFKLAPCIGQMVAEQIALGESRILPIEPYRPTRFDDGAAFRKAYTGTGAMA